MEIIVRLSKTELTAYGGDSKRLTVFVYELLEHKTFVRPLPTGQTDLDGVHVTVEFSDVASHR